MGPNKYYTPGQSGPESNDNEKVLHITLRLEPHHQMQFNGIPKTSASFMKQNPFFFPWLIVGKQLTHYVLDSMGIMHFILFTAYSQHSKSAFSIHSVMDWLEFMILEYQLPVDVICHCKLK